MQSYNPEDELVNTEMINNMKTSEETELKTLQETMNEIEEEKGASHHIIGKLPTKMQVIEINGLKYEVTYVDKIVGRLHLKLMRPKK